MTSCRGMLHQKPLRSFSELAVALTSLVASGCILFESGLTRMPTMHGTWQGLVRPVTVMTKDHVQHEVAGVLLEHPIDLTVDTSGTGLGNKSDGERLFWHSWHDLERVALLVRNGCELVPYDELTRDSDHVLFIGDVRYDDIALLHGRRAVRLILCDVITKADGTIGL